MSLYKAIYYGKEKRKPYRGSGAFDWSCHNHKSCAYCRSNRTIQAQRMAEAERVESVESHRPNEE